MPVTVKKIGDKFRVTERNGKIARNAKGTPVDGDGHGTHDAAMKQARAINANMHKEK